MPKFNQGDLVVLNSGGPTMTVEGYAKSDPNKVICTWFNKDQERVTKHFREGTLSKFKP